MLLGSLLASYQPNEYSLISCFFHHRNLRFRAYGDEQWTDCKALTAHGGLPISNFWTSDTENCTEIESDALYLFIIGTKYVCMRNTNICYLQLVLLTLCYLNFLEKEGIFRRMCDDGFTQAFRCIIVTGCGYPDIATRALVHRLKYRLPHLKVLGLCDFNPYGLALLLTYKFGSKNMSLEGDGLSIPSLKVLGLRSAQLQTLQLDPSCFEPLSSHDQSKIESLLGRGDLPESYINEIEAMRAINKKCELEVMYTKGIGFITEFYTSAILRGDYF